MGGGKGGAPPPPDYGPIAAANRAAVESQERIAQEQLAWARERFEYDRGITDRVLATLIPQLESESAAAAQTRERYESIFRPIEDQFIAEVAAYDTPERRESEAARAVADVANAMEGQRQGAFARLESFGVDPSMARSGALDSNVRVFQAALSAGAANEARRQVEETGRALRGEVINLGMGYPAQVAQAYATSQAAGQGSVGNQLATTASGAQTMGTGNQWMAGSNQVLGAWGNQVGGMNQAYIQAEAQRANQSPWGSILGGIAGLALSPIPGGSLLGGAFGSALGGNMKSFG